MKTPGKSNIDKGNKNTGKTNTGKPQKEDKKPLPGEYPPREDMMNARDIERVHVDPDTLSTSRKSSSELKQEQQEDTQSSPSARTNDSDLTREDYEALGPKDLSMDMGEDETLKHRTWPVDFAARDLDVPGSELDDKNEMLGEEDEENNSYSLGGDKET